MQLFNRVCFIVLLIATTPFACTDNNVADDQDNINPTLAGHILDCEDITEKAAAHLKAVVEFQKLEIAGRKAHVFKQCMHDRGYTESPAWLAHSKKTATQTSQESQISSDEALENLRRSDMKHPTGVDGKPSYWVIKQ